MTTDNRIDYISKSELFSGIALGGIQDIAVKSEILDLPAHHKIISHGDSTNSLYIIISGEINVSRSHGKHELTIATLKSSQTFGESGLLKRNFAIANIITKTAVKLLRIPYLVLKNNLPIYNAICMNIASSYSDRLNYTNVITLLHYKQREKESHKRIRLGTFLINTIIAMMMYIACLAVYYSKYSNQVNFQTPKFTMMLLIGILLIYLKILHNLRIPLKVCGFSLNVSRTAIIESIIYSIYVCIFIVFFKVIFLYYMNGAVQFHKIFDFYPMFDSKGNYIGIYDYFTSMFAYLPFILVQEFVYRGCLQGIIHQYYLDNNLVHKWQAIFIANIVFTASHAHLYSYAIPVFFLGLFWGWLYFRSQNLIPVCISHIMIAIWSFFIVGFFGLIN